MMHLRPQTLGGLLRKIRHLIFYFRQRMPQFCCGLPKLVYFPLRKQIFLQLKIRLLVSPRRNSQKSPMFANRFDFNFIAASPNLLQASSFGISSPRRHLVFRNLLAFSIDKFLFPICVLNLKVFNWPIRPALSLLYYRPKIPIQFQFLASFLVRFKFSSPEFRKLPDKFPEFCLGRALPKLLHP